MNAKPEYLTAIQAAELLQMHPATIRRLLKAGRLPGIRIGGQWRLNPADLKPRQHEEVKPGHEPLFRRLLNIGSAIEQQQQQPEENP